MSHNRKLRTEIDRTLKKVSEGVELFEEIWDKIYSTNDQGQREKYAVELKKELKKLQRCRDSVKTWISSNAIKDKRELTDIRKLIESKMEMFKECEKEVKTKAYSKEGLAQVDEVDPEDQARQETREWVQEAINKIDSQIDEFEAELEGLQSRGGRRNRDEIDAMETSIEKHRWHISKLEQILRLLDNDALDHLEVNKIKDDLEYYVESNQEPDFFPDDEMYEPLDLDDIKMINTRLKAKEEKRKLAEKERERVREEKEKQERERKERERKDKDALRKKKEAADNAKRALADKKKQDQIRIQKDAAARNAKRMADKAAGGSMANMLRNSDHRRQQMQQQQRLRMKEDEARRKEEERKRQEQRRALHRLQKQQQPSVVSSSTAIDGASAASASGRPQPRGVRQATMREALRDTQAMSSQAGSGGVGRETTGTKVRSVIGSFLGRSNAPGIAIASAQAAAAICATSDMAETEQQGTGDRALELEALQASMQHMHPSDSEYVKQYFPLNPAPQNGLNKHFPTVPVAAFDNQTGQLYSKFDTDALFFIFYHQQGTYQQYLAAKELKKQSWRFHKKYRTWFQRHEEPKVTTEEYEQGTYVYFDYETGWYQRIKSEFTFEYSYLEDDLVV